MPGSPAARSSPRAASSRSGPNRPTVIHSLSVAGAGAETFALGGSFTKNSITGKIEAHINGGANVTASTDILITAKDDPEIQSFAGGFAGSGSAAIGAAVAIDDIGGAIKARAIGSTLTGTNGNVRIHAESTAEIDSIAVGGGGAGTVGIAGSVAVNSMGNTVQTSIEGGTVTADDNVTVTANTQLDLFSIVGTVAAGGSAGLGGSVTINTFSNITKAFISGGATVTGKGNATVAVPLADGSGATELVRGVAVIATEDNEIDVFTATGSVGGSAGIAASVSVTIVEDTVEAYINGATVNPSNGAHNAGQGVRVRALNLLDLDAKAGGLAIGGSAGVGATTDVQVVGNTVKAYLSNVANVRARTGGVLVTAFNHETAKSITITGAGAGSAGVAGNVPVLTIGSLTEAHVTGSTVNTTGDLRVIADSELRIGDDPVGIIAGAVAVGGAAGVGATVVVIVADPVTRAHISNSITDASGTTEVRADSLEVIRVLGITGAFGGYAGIGGAVIVSHVETETQAYIDGPSQVNQTLSGLAQDVIVQAKDDVTMADIAGSAAAGLVGVSASIDVMSLTNLTAAYIGSGATVSAGRDVKVLAEQHRDVTSVVVGFGGGLVGIQGSIAVINIGSGFSAAGKDALPSEGQSDDASLSDIGGAASEQASGSTGSKVGTVAGSDPTATTATTRANARTSAIDLSADFATGAPAAEGTSASIGGNVTAGRDIIVQATDVTELNVTGGSIAAGVVGLGVGVAVANVHANTEAFIDGGTLAAGRDVKVIADYGLNEADGTCNLGSLSDCLGRAFAGGGGLVALFGAVIVVEDESTVSAWVGGSAHIVDADSVSVRAESDRHVNLLTGQVGGGFVAAGAAVAVGTIGGSTKAWIGDSAQVGKAALTSVGMVSVVADADASLDIDAVSISAGFVGASANAADATAGGTVEASINGSAQVEATGAITVEAISLDNADTHGTGVNVGAAGVGLSLAFAEISTIVNAFVGGTANVDAGTGLTIRARHNTAADGSEVAGKKASAVVLVGSGGIAAIGVSVADADANAAVDAFVESGATLHAGGDIVINGFADNDAEAESSGIGGGVAAVGIFFADAAAGGAAKARMNGTITDAATITVLAKSDFDATATVLSVQVGAVSVDGMDADATVSGQTLARVEGDVEDGASLTVRSRTSNSATVTINMWNIGLLVSVGGAFGDAEIADEAANEASIGAAASITVTGAVVVDAGQTSANSATSNLDRKAGGFISGGVLVSEATIHGGVLAQLDGDVDAGSLSVTADGDNTATATTAMVGGGALSFTGAGTLANIGETRTMAPTRRSRRGSATRAHRPQRDADRHRDLDEHGDRDLLRGVRRRRRGHHQPPDRDRRRRDDGRVRRRRHRRLADLDRRDVEQHRDGDADRHHRRCDRRGRHRSRRRRHPGRRHARVGRLVGLDHGAGRTSLGHRQRPQPRHRDRHERLGRLRVATR